MTLERGSVRGYEFDRMVLLFSMMDGAREVSCAVSTSAMDDLEHVARTAPDQREEQFLRLRDRIEQCASRKFLAREFEGNSSRHHPAQHRFSQLMRLVALRRKPASRGCITGASRADSASLRDRPAPPPFRTIRGRALRLRGTPSPSL